MKNFKLEDLSLQKADVSRLNGGICHCCNRPPQNGIAPYGAAAGCDSQKSLDPKKE